MNPTIIAILFSLAGGFLPAFIWLAFWLQEDHDHPEPAKRIFGAFGLGMLTVPIAVGVQLLMHKYLMDGAGLGEAVSNSFIGGGIFVFVWALLEELLKFGAAYFAGIHTRDTDEAIDILVYMIAAALGFAALENTFYLFTPLLEGNVTSAILNGNMRFIGSTLLHVATSAIFGYTMAIAFFKNKVSKIEHVITGLIIATVLHTIFNLFIIATHATFMIWGLILVWIGTLILFFLFEKIKHVHLNKI